MYADIVRNDGVGAEKKMRKPPKPSHKSAIDRFKAAFGLGKEKTDQPTTPPDLSAFDGMDFGLATVSKELSDQRIRAMTDKEKLELTTNPGTLRTCQNCGVRYWDLGMKEPVCPATSCGAKLDESQGILKSTGSSLFEVLQGTHAAVVGVTALALALPALLIAGVGQVGLKTKNLVFPPDLEKAKKEILEQTKDIPNQDIVYEQAAHHHAYNPSSKLPPGWGLERTGEIDDKETGLYAGLFTPVKGVDSSASHGREVHSVIAFRGTNDFEDIRDDLSVPGIGTVQFAKNAKAIAGLFSKGAKFGKIDVVGHSLGGALAQIAAARTPGRVGRVVTFQAPGISPEDAQRLKAFNEQAEEPILGSHYRVGGIIPDVAPLAGDTMIGGSVVEFRESDATTFIDKHTDFPLAKLNKLRDEDGVEISPKVDVGRNLKSIEILCTEDEERIAGTILETVRKTLKLGSKDDALARFTQTLLSVCDVGVLSLRRLHAIIDDTPEVLPQHRGPLKEAMTAYHEERERSNLSILTKQIGLLRKGSTTDEQVRTIVMQTTKVGDAGKKTLLGLLK